MVDVKEIKSVKIVPFTFMTSWITAISGLIVALIILLFSGIIAAIFPANLGGLVAGLGIASIIVLPIGGFLTNIVWAFVTAWIYNLLVPKVGGIKLGMEGNEITNVPVIPLALITSLIMTIWAFIIGLILTAIAAPFLGILSVIPQLLTTFPGLANNTTAIEGMGAAVGASGILIAVILIIAVPIVVFIGSFIGYALSAVFYNILIPKVGGIKLELAAAAHKFTEITNIPVVPFALAVAVVATVWGIIQGLLNMAMWISQGDPVGGVVSLIANIVISFISAFIAYAITALIYNFLSPKIGGIELELE
ncbi:MAG: hypothetical protein Kow0019_02370 [Methanobacteriaceae archaeon]